MAEAGSFSATSRRLRLSAPPGIAEVLLAPLVTAFAAFHPDVRLQVSVGNRPGDGPADRADLMFRLETLEDSSLIALKVLRYRNLLVASPGYLARHKAPTRPGDLARHRLLTLLDRTPGQRWTFVRFHGAGRDTLHVRPHLATGDTAGLVATVLANGDICALPPVVQSDLLRDGRLVEVMPDWKLEASDLFLVHLGRRHVPRPVQLFKEMAASIIPGLFPNLPG